MASTSGRLVEEIAAQIKAADDFGSWLDIVESAQTSTRRMAWRAPGRAIHPTRMQPLHRGSTSSQLVITPGKLSPYVVRLTAGSEVGVRIREG